MPFELVKPDTKIDFIGKRKLCGAISAALIIASLVATQVNGVKLGIDFAGGTELQVKFDEGIVGDEGAIREVVGAVDGIDHASVVRYGEASHNEFLIKFMGDITNAGEDSIGEDRIEILEQGLVAKIGPLTRQRVEFVGPRVGEELRDDGLKALFWASVVVLIYIAVRFSSRFAPGAIVAVLHDLLITAGIFVLFGLEFDLRILAAMLAILGYSLNDTIIIYDRIRENMELHTKVDLPEVLNVSVNQTLSRTVLTSGTTLLALGSLFFLGGTVIRPFALAMIIGVVVGTYSSIYIASPTLLLLEQYLDRGDSTGGAKKSAKPAETAKAAKKTPKKAAKKTTKKKAKA